MNWTFAQALECVKAGGNARRPHCQPGSRICLRPANERCQARIIKRGSRNGHERIYPYQAGSHDMLATDWESAP